MAILLTPIHLVYQVVSTILFSFHFARICIMEYFKTVRAFYLFCKRSKIVTSLSTNDDITNRKPYNGVYFTILIQAKWKKNNLVETTYQKLVVSSICATSVMNDTLFNYTRTLHWFEANIIKSLFLWFTQQIQICVTFWKPAAWIVSE